MNKKLKIAAYVVLGICGLWLGTGLINSLARPTASPPKNPPGTNDSTTVAATNAAASTHVVASTNAPPATNAAAAAEALTPSDANAFSSARVSRILTYGAGLLGVVIGLAFLISHDVSHIVANRVEDFIFNDQLEGVRNPAYENAEQVWADGRYLDAIQLLRDYLQEHPREQYVALRIAEIYEKDLHNYLAAALEYEEVLKKKLPPERWGWAAVHLANLYSGKLNRSTDAEALLRRIAEEYGQTAAAKKARERLGIPEPVEETPPEPEPPAPEAPKVRVASIEEQMAELQAEFQQEVETPPEPSAPAAEPPTPKLPPGFRPKS